MSHELPFEVWKLRLEEDCEHQDKLLAYKKLGEECLKVLWEMGTEPSVEGVIARGAKVVEGDQYSKMMTCPHCHQQTGIGTAAHFDHVFMSRTPCERSGKELLIVDGIAMADEKYRRKDRPEVI